MRCIGIAGIVYRNGQFDFYAIYIHVSIYFHLFDTFRELINDTVLSLQI